MDRFEIAPVEREAKDRKNEKELCLPPAGPSSVNPGPWLRNIYETTKGAEGEVHDAVLAILESYRPGQRSRHTRAPISGQAWESESPTGTFIDLGQDIENKATCYAVVPPFGRRSFSYQFHDTEGLDPNPNAPRFPMMDQPNVLSGPAWLEYRQEVQARVPGYYAERKKKRKKPEARVEHRKVSMATVEGLYASWVEDPSADNEATLWAELYALLQKRVDADRTADGRKLSRGQQSQDFLNGFTMSLWGLLRQKQTTGEKIGNFGAYLNRAWKVRRIDALKELTREDRQTAQLSVAPVNEDGSKAPGFEDQWDYTLASVHDYDAEPVPSLAEESRSREEVLRVRTASLSMLPPDIRDMVGYMVEGMKEREMAERLGKSRQAVGRLKVKATNALNAAVQIVKAAHV